LPEDLTARFLGGPHGQTFNGGAKAEEQRKRKDPACPSRIEPPGQHNSNKHNEADGQGRSFQSISVLADNSYGASSQVRVFSLPPTHVQSKKEM